MGLAAPDDNPRSVEPSDHNTEALIRVLSIENIGSSMAFSTAQSRIKQAKPLTKAQVEAVLGYLAKTRHPIRNRLIFLLSIRQDFELVRSLS